MTGTYQDLVYYQVTIQPNQTTWTFRNVPMTYYMQTTDRYGHTTVGAKIKGAYGSIQQVCP
jgi:hypothetical protein